MNSLSLILTFLLFSFSLRASEVSSVDTFETKKNNNQNLKDFCETKLGQYKSYFKDSQLAKVCESANVIDSCRSVRGAPIFHVDEKGKNEKAKNILVFSLIHGDETGAGVLGRYWMERLVQLDPRNNWRIIPILNPDGTDSKTRINANGVDLNRNFPTQDWNEKAVAYWKAEGQSSKRKFPGQNPGSEPEVNCAMKHIQDFNPEFVVSIHTPLNVLDFDGPKIRPPIYSYLPWKRLGNFPGSLGRFLWVEKNIPVLTTELKQSLPPNGTPFELLQDVIGQLVQKDLK